MRNPMLAAATLALIVSPAAPAGAEGGGSGAGDLHLVPMDALTVPIVDGGQVQGALSFTLVLQASDAAAAARLGEELPSLRAAALGAGIEFARLRASSFAPVDVAQLDHDLSAALTAADPGVARVLIVEVAARRG